MKKGCFIIVLILFYSIRTNAQQKALEVKYKRNDDRTVDFSFKKKNPGSMYITITFNRLENANNKRVISKTVKGVSGSLFRLKPLNVDKGISFSYSIKAIKGSHKAKPDHEFKYVLPFKKNKEVTVYDVSHIGVNKPDSWKSTQFITKPNDTVYAARKGIVVDIKDGFVVDANNEYSYKRNSNRILIEHKDGTLAEYSVLKNNSMLVELGDKVYPNTPIAICGTYDKPENSQLRFTVYYLDKDAVTFKNSIEEKLSNIKPSYAYVNPIFFTKNTEERLLSGNTYISSCTKEIIELEMTKREKKKWQKMKSK